MKNGNLFVAGTCCGGGCGCGCCWGWICCMGVTLYKLCWCNWFARCVIDAIMSLVNGDTLTSCWLIGCELCVANCVGFVIVFILRKWFWTFAPYCKLGDCCLLFGIYAMLLIELWCKCWDPVLLHSINKKGQKKKKTVSTHDQFSNGIGVCCSNQ